jgi:tetratricopeptide (TPR) repeat protein
MPLSRAHTAIFRRSRAGHFGTFRLAGEKSAQHHITGASCHLWRLDSPVACVLPKMGQHTGADKNVRAETERGEVTTLPSKRRLTGWKEIGAHFGKNERTVKRWELQRGLPVHRLPGGAKTAVFADVLELEEWLKGSRVASALAETPESETQPQSPALAARELPATAARKFSRRSTWTLAAIAVALIGAASAYPALRGEPPRHTPPAEAAQYYQTGLYHWNTRTPDGLRQSLDEFSRAIALDPNYAAAQAGLANAYNLLAQYGVMKPGEAYPLAKAAAEKAIALDPRLADGHGALGFALFYGFRDLARSETLFKEALALDPNSSRTLHWYALIMMHTGKFDEPLRAITRAQELDPQSYAVRANRGLILFYAGRSDEAIHVLTDLTQSAPTFMAPYHYLATIYLDQQRYDAYLGQAMAAAELEKNAAAKAAIAAATAGYRTAGADGLFTAMLAVQKSALARGEEAAFNVARTAALLGDRDTALAMLQQSLASGEPDLLGIRIDRAFKSLHGDPQFQQIADRALVLP